MTPRRAPLWQIVAAFAAVYLVWGSTYLAIRFAVESLPVFSYAGVRFVIAGAFLYAVTRGRGAPRPRREQWIAATVVGALLLLGGNGGVSVAERTVPSGIAAVLIATVPLWMVLLHWWRGGVRPTASIALAIVAGLVGVALLVGPAELAGGDRVDPIGAGILVLASLSWAAGSLYSRGAPTPPVPLLGAGMQQVAGGVLLLAAGLVTGEFASFRPEEATPRSIAALVYLILFGSLVGYTAYIWLLRQVSPALVSTYAYVNPVVAVFLGWALASEPITARTLVAAAIIVGAVALITTEQTRTAIREHRERQMLEAEPEGSPGK